MAKILLINPSYVRTYGNAKLSVASPVFPTLGLATIAATAREGGHKVCLLELCYLDYDPNLVRETIIREKPDFIGVTATTPLMNQLRDIAHIAKHISNRIMVIGGGSHPSALPTESMDESVLDFICYGESDYTFAELVDGKPPKDILGLVWRDGDRIVMNAPRPLIDDLDGLPMPAWDLFPAAEYRHRVTRLIVRRPPASMVEFSRGCVFQCDFCSSKNTMGFGYRKKSPERCAEEMLALRKLGYGEALLADDIFTSDNRWAVDVCRAITRKKTGMLWTCTNGIRVDSAKTELFSAMYEAGCYRVHFGFESGNDAVLKAFGKGGRASLEQGREAVRAARAAGMDTFGMYMFGLSADTPRSMQDTIDYGKTTPVDMMRFGITVPLPGTKMFNDLRGQGHIRTYDWDLYNVYNTDPIYEHPVLSHAVIMDYYHRAHVEAYWKNPRFILRRFLRGLRTGEFLWDAYYAMKMRFGRDTALASSYDYAHRDEWPAHEFRRDNGDVVPLLRPVKRTHQQAQTA